jgi:hypothetical protein
LVAIQKRPTGMTPAPPENTDSPIARRRATVDKESSETTLGVETKRPLDLAQRIAARRARRAASDPASDPWRRETFCLPRADARIKAREWFDRYPKAAYMTEIEFWRELADGRIEFVMRRLPSAE